MGQAQEMLDPPFPITQLNKHLLVGQHHQGHFSDFEKIPPVMSRLNSMCKISEVPLEAISTVKEVRTSAVYLFVLESHQSIDYIKSIMNNTTESEKVFYGDPCAWLISFSASTI